MQDTEGWVYLAYTINRESIVVNGEEVEDVEELPYQGATVENVRHKWLNKNNESKAHAD